MRQSAQLKNTKKPTFHFVSVLFLLAFSRAEATEISCKQIYESLSIKTQLRAGLTNPKMVPHIEDVYSAQFISDVKKMGAVSLVVGNSTRVNSKKNLQMYVELAKKISDAGYAVLYDADASTAQAIREAAKPRGIGISANKSSSNGQDVVVKIENMHMRLDAFGEQSKGAGQREHFVIASTDSLVGMGLLIHRKVKSVIDTNGSWTNQLANWNQEVNIKNRNLGIKYQEIPVIASSDAIAFEKNERKFSLGRKPIDQIDESIAVVALNHANAMIQAEQNGGLSNGAVIFGSGKIDPHSAASVYEISYALGSHGIDGTTGGAGGAMWLANSGFYDAGAVSIGIPIVGRNQLKSETRVRAESQTHTIGVENYDQRVYQLIKNRKFIGFVPGGSGTMRELAATMLMMAPDPSIKVLLGFVDGDYYGSLVNFLMQLPLPKAFKNRVVADIDVKSVPSLVEKLKTFGLKSTLDAITPRREGGRYDASRFIGKPGEY